jgi:membrane protein implicated in regulation of membrane protease activity
MSQPNLWWLAVGALVALELVTGTFYLLMLALGGAAAAIAAYAGAGASAQIVCAALVGGGAVALWHVRRARHGTELPAQTNPNVNLDIGELVQVQAWNPDGTAQVQYRGAAWTAIHRSGVSPAPGKHRVAELVGNRLLLDRVS